VPNPTHGEATFFEAIRYADINNPTTDDRNQHLEHLFAVADYSMHSLIEASVISDHILDLLPITDPIRTTVQLARDLIAHARTIVTERLTEEQWLVMEFGL
jgi:hypothetical protein